MTLLELMKTIQTCPNLLSKIVIITKDDTQYTNFKFIYDDQTTYLQIK